MYVRLFVVCCFFFNSLHCFAQTSIVLNTTGEPPLNTPDQKGFMDLVAGEAFSRIGISLRTVQLPAERGLKNANQGVEDGEMSRIAGLSKHYSNLIQVPEKIMDWEFVVYSNKKVNLDNGWQSLASESVSFINGWKILERNVPSQAEITKVKTPHQLFTLLKKDRTDLVVYERWSGLSIIRTLGLSNTKMQQPPLATKAMFIYLHKKHKKIVVTLAAALKQMKIDGSYQKIATTALSPWTTP